MGMRRLLYFNCCLRVLLREPPICATPQTVRAFRAPLLPSSTGYRPPRSRTRWWRCPPPKLKSRMGPSPPVQRGPHHVPHLLGVPSLRTAALWTPEPLALLFADSTRWRVFLRWNSRRSRDLDLRSCRLSLSDPGLVRGAVLLLPCARSISRCWPSSPHVIF